MYPILEYSSTYLILEYYPYFHTNTLYIYTVFLWSIYMYILTVSVYTILMYADSFNTPSPHCVLMRTLLLTQSVLVLTLSADVRINVIIIWIVHTLFVCVSVRFTDVCLRVPCDFLLFGQHILPKDEVVIDTDCPFHIWLHQSVPTLVVYPPFDDPHILRYSSSPNTISSWTMSLWWNHHTVQSPVYPCGRGGLRGSLKKWNVKP